MIDELKIYALAIFGVVAGQFLRMGSKIEKGQPVTWRDVFVMFSLLPAFGALIGAATTHFGWSVPLALAVSICAGWLGFGAMRSLLALVRGQFPKMD